jgi:hypothetical protein
MELTVYGRPQVSDYGTVVDLMAAFDLSFVGSAAKGLAMAAVSAPVAGGGGAQHGGVLSGGPVSGGSDGGAGGAGKSIVGGIGGLLGGGPGKLPFTGYPAVLAAALGALLATVGGIIRSVLRRQPVSARRRRHR